MSNWNSPRSYADIAERFKGAHTFNCRTHNVQGEHVYVCGDSRTRAELTDILDDCTRRVVESANNVHRRYMSNDGGFGGRKPLDEDVDYYVHRNGRVLAYRLNNGTVILNESLTDKKDIKIRDMAARYIPATVNASY